MTFLCKCDYYYEVEVVLYALEYLFGVSMEEFIYPVKIF